MLQMVLDKYDELEDARCRVRVTSGGLPGPRTDIRCQPLQEEDLQRKAGEHHSEGNLAHRGLWLPMQGECQPRYLVAPFQSQGSDHVWRGPQPFPGPETRRETRATVFLALVPGRFKDRNNSGDGLRNMLRAVCVEACARFRGSTLRAEALAEAPFGRYSSTADAYPIPV